MSAISGGCGGGGGEAEKENIEVAHKGVESASCNCKSYSKWEVQTFRRDCHVLVCIRCNRGRTFFLGTTTECNLLQVLMQWQPLAAYGRWSFNYDRL